MQKAKANHSLAGRPFRFLFSSSHQYLWPNHIICGISWSHWIGCTTLAKSKLAVMLQNEC